jgi:DNA-binding HxlR family transcriptional regulator
MDPNGGYHQFCPVALAAELVCTRWTALILRDLLGGSVRFNELQRGVPRMSPALLSKRLKEMEEAKLIRRVAAGGASEYHLTEAGRELAPVVEALGRWGMRWIDPEVTLEKLDAPLLMWKLRCGFDPTPQVPGRCTIEFAFPEQTARRGQRFWLIVTGSDVELCATEPGHETDVWVTTALRTMTAIWLGLASPEAESAARRLEIDGPSDKVAAVRRWLGQSPAAKARRQLAAPAVSAAG